MTCRKKRRVFHHDAKLSVFSAFYYIYFQERFLVFHGHFRILYVLKPAQPELEKTIAFCQQALEIAK